MVAARRSTIAFGRDRPVRQRATVVTRAAGAATPTGRAFQVVATITALSVGALQMYHVRGGILTDYGADVFGTAWVYATTRFGKTFIQRGRILGAGASAAIVFLLCA